MSEFEQDGIARAVFRFKFGDDDADFRRLWGEGVSLPDFLSDDEGITWKPNARSTLLVQRDFHHLFNRYFCPFSNNFWVNDVGAKRESRSKLQRAFQHAIVKTGLLVCWLKLSNCGEKCMQHCLVGNVCPEVTGRSLFVRLGRFHFSISVGSVGATNVARGGRDHA